MIMKLSQNSIFLENIFLSKTRLGRIKISTYLLCKYDDRYWIGIVSDIDEAAGGVKLKFMHPHYPKVSFFWPSRDACTAYTHNNNHSNTTIIICISFVIYYF